MMLARICGLFAYPRLILSVFPALLSKWHATDRPHAPGRSHIVSSSRPLGPGRWPSREFDSPEIDGDEPSCIHHGTIPMRRATACVDGTERGFFARAGPIDRERCH